MGSRSSGRRRTRSRPRAGAARWSWDPTARTAKPTPARPTGPEAGPGGRWEVEGGALRLDGADGSTQTLQVVSAAPDRLVLRP